MSLLRTQVAPLITEVPAAAETLRRWTDRARLRVGAYTGEPVR